MTPEEVKAAIQRHDPNVEPIEAAVEKVANYTSIPTSLERTDEDIFALYCWAKGLMEL